MKIGLYVVIAQGGLSALSAVNSTIVPVSTANLEQPIRILGKIPIRNVLIHH